MNPPLTTTRFAQLVQRALFTAGLSLLPRQAGAELVALWDFDQTTPFGVAVDARAGLAPQVLGGAAVSADGAGHSGSAGDRAMSFGATVQRLHLLDASYFTAAAAADVMSVSFWIRHNAVKASTALSFVAPSTLGGRGFQAHAPWSDGTIYFDTGGCCDATMRTSINPGASWPATWHHVTLVKNGAAKDIYLDGVLRTSGVNTAPINVVITEFFLGNAPNTGESVNGDMDDFAVYSHALTATDAANLFAGASPLTLATTATDSEPDGLPDMWELRFVPDLTVLSGGAADNDGDGLANVNEVIRGTDPNVADSDADGLSDSVETGTGIWVSASDTGTVPTRADTDGDTLFDGYETNTGVYLSATNSGTNPNTRDYDGDLIEDGVEILYGSNPVNAASTPITPGVPTLLAWWQFDDDTNAPSPRDTRVGHAGTLLGASGYSADAEGGTGLAGDKALRITAGGGKMRLADAPWVNMATRLDKMTVTYWIKVTSQPGASACWFTSPSSNNNFRGFQAHCPYSNTTVYFDTAGCCVANQRLSGVVSDVPWTNTWHHCVLMKDGGNKSVWIDGVQKLSSTGAAPLPADFTAFTVGADQANGSILGWIDDFAIFASPLSTQEISDLFTRTRTPLQIGASTDSDSDGLPDLWEYIYFPADLSRLGAAPADYDSDGSTDVNELAKDTNPNDSDTDNDTLLDGMETGTGVWVSTSDRGTNPKNIDSDSDRLTDNVETNTDTYVSAADTGTDPNDPDSDSDGFRDGYEVPYGSNPNITAAVPFTPGQSFLLALWDFNNTSNPASANDVIAGFTGASTGTYSPGGEGRSGALTDHAMCFDPDQAVTVDGSFINLAAPGDAFTISFWQKLDTMRNSSSFWVASPSAGAASSYRGIQAHSPWSDGNIYFDHSGCCDPNINRINGLLPPMDITEWHHFAFLKNGATKRVYVDGILVVDGSGIPLVNDLTTLTIGGGPAGYMDGCIDDFAIYAGGLTHEQICRLNGGESPQTILLPAPGGPFEITAVQLLPADQIQLTWNSTPGCTYRVESSNDLVLWENLAVGIPSGGNTTVATINLTPGLGRIFLRVTEM